MKGGAIMKVCRVCLSTDSKLYDMEQYNLDEPYKMVTGINVTGETYPDMLCVECAQRLLNCIKFRGKCIRGHILLTEIWDTYGGLTTQSLKSVDRHQSSLVSQLQVKHIEADHYDLYCDHTDTHTDGMPIDSIEEMKTDDVFVVEIKKDSTDVTADDFAETKNEMDDQFDQIDTEYDANGMHTAEVEIQNVDSASRRKVDVKCKSRAPKSSVLKTKRPTKAISKSKKRKTIKKERSDSEASELSKEMDTEVVEKEPKKALTEMEWPEVYCKNFTWTSKDLNDVDENDKVFTITKITFEEQKEEIEKRKEGINYKKAEFKCGMCFKGFIDDAAYNNHMIRHSKKCGDYHCEICKTYYKTPHKLKWHMKCYHTCRFICNKCPYDTRLQSAARRHVSFHKGVKYKCIECSREFTKATTLFSHRRLKHSCDFVCEKCGYSFLSEMGVRFHKNKQHKLDKSEITSDSPWCETCNIQFYSEDALKVHISVSDKHRTIDDKNRKNTPTEYNQRQYTHKWVKLKLETPPIPCEQCGVLLDTPRAYFIHFKRSHPGMTRTVYNSTAMQSPHMCEICGRMFQKGCQLRDHKFVHTGEKTFKCNQCDKTFINRINLHNHKKVHMEKRPLYDCPTCGKSYTNYANMKRHSRKHQGDNGYLCSECGKSFTTSYAKRAHYKHVHLKEPWPKRTRVRREASAARATEY